MPTAADDAPRHGIRRATTADVAAVEAITDAAYTRYIERIGQPPMPMRADHAADVAAGRVYVTGQPAVGLVVVVPHDDHLLLESIAVHPDVAGSGLGRQLLEFVDDHTRALGLDEVRLYTHVTMVENQQIYPRFGYALTARRITDGLDRLHYRKRLA